MFPSKTLHSQAEKENVVTEAMGGKAKPISERGYERISIEPSDNGGHIVRHTPKPPSKDMTEGGTNPSSSQHPGADAMHSPTESREQTHIFADHQSALHHVGLLMGSKQQD